jgi:hypothetical protein
MAQNASGSDNQIINARRNRLDVRRADEDAKGVMFDRDAPRPLACLGHMHFAVPTGQDDIVLVATNSFKPQAFPE